MEAIPLLLKAIAHLEEILVPILRTASFSYNYLLTKYPKFRQIDAIRYKMATGFTKCGHNRNSSDTVRVLLKSVVRRLSQILTTHGTLLEEVVEAFEEVVPPLIRRSFHMLRMTWYLIWGASLVSFDSFTHVSWILLYRWHNHLIVYVYFTISLGFVKR
jgi:hypothetical protein